MADPVNRNIATAPQSDFANQGLLGIDDGEIVIIPEAMTALRDMTEEAKGWASAALTSAERIDLGELDDARAATKLDAEATSQDRDKTTKDRAATDEAVASANAAKISTEAARDSTFLNAIVYADVATGLASTAENDQFFVIVGSDVVRYRHDAGPSATEILRFPTKVAYDILVDLVSAEVNDRKRTVQSSNGYRSKDLLVVVDAAGSVIGRVDQESIWHVLLGQLKRGDGLEVDTFVQNADDGFVVVTSDGTIVFDSRRLPETLIASDGFEVTYFDRNSPGGIVVIDSAGNIIAELDHAASQNAQVAAASLTEEISKARGSQTSLDGRLSQSISPEGGLRLPRVNRDAMRQMRLRQAQLRAGTSLQINHVLCGDSFTHNWKRWSGTFARGMVARYGDGGGGWTGYGYQGAYAGPYATGGAQPTLVNGNARPELYPITYDGAWDRVTLSPSPDMVYITSSTPGDKITREVPAAPDHTALRLVWIATADGVVRWRVDGGDWEALAVQGAFETIQWADIPLTAGAHSVEIEIVTGTVKLCGDVALSDAPGYRVHKIARSGSRVSQWVDQDEAQQRAAWELLEATAWTYMEGTNSQTTPGQVTPATWRGQMAAMVTRMRAASVEADICLFMPPDNQRANNAHDMPEYADQARDLAYEMAVAFLDAQPAFGPDRMAYGHDQPFALFHTDLTHPNYGAGGVQLSSLAVDFHDFHPTTN